MLIEKSFMESPDKENVDIKDGKSVKTQQMEVATAFAVGGHAGNAGDYASVLQALIDLYSQPVYIKGPHGVVMNEEAARLAREGVNLPTGDAAVTAVTFRSRKWRCERYDMNHNTGCALFKMESIEHTDDPQIRRARECMMRLDAFFGAPPLTAPAL